MKRHTTAYLIKNADEICCFGSEKEACDYLGVRKSTVSGCFREGCKCKGYEVYKVGTTTHNSSKTRLYKIWGGMKERCFRAKHTHYKDYGGRGITVCEEWKGEDGFYSFREWALKNGYSDNLTLDRIDNNGNYEPMNCRWITVKEQMNNKRTSHFVIANGDKMTVAQCSQKYNIPKSTIIWREKHGRNILNGSKMQIEEDSE